MNTRIDASAAGTPQAPTDTHLARLLEGESGGLGMKAQRALQLTTPGGTPGKANRAMPLQSDRRTQTALLTPVPMPNRTPNMTAVPMPIWPGNNTAVPMPNRTPKGEAVPRIGSGDWPRRAPPVCIDFEPPRVALAPDADVKGTGKSPAKPPSPVFTPGAQQEAFKSVVHLTNGGSGVIVANKGNEYMLLTNQHCLTGKAVGDKVEFKLSDGSKVTGEIAAIGDRNAKDGHDLAAVMFTSTRKLTTAKIATTEPKVEQTTFSIGYPFTGTGTSTPKPSDRVDPATGAMVAEGKVTANRRDGEGQINGEYGLVTSSRVIQGMSGGGMFDTATGELIAINGMGANAIMPPEVQDGISFRQTVGKEGRSVGIAADEIGQFLRQNKSALPDFARG